MGKIDTKSIIGQKFNKLLVSEFVPIENRPNKGYKWKCVCDCGKIVYTSKYQ